MNETWFPNKQSWVSSLHMFFPQNSYLVEKARIITTALGQDCVKIIRISSEAT